MKFCPECFEEYADDVVSCPADSYALTALEEDPLVGTRLADRYEILSVLGRGGMGVVYKARQENLDRVVAIKMLHSHLVSDTEALKRFHREAKAVSRVRHGNTVSLFDFGISPEGQPFLVMDYIEGKSLKRILKEEGPLSLERAAHIFGQVMDALAHAHAEGVIHRDLKPENIMLTKRGNDPEWVEVVDFGISKLKTKDNQTVDKLTRLGDACGSPPYMSPEQCLASVPVDARSDIYAVGVVLYEALSGKLPFKAKTAVEMIDCHLYVNPTPLKVANPDLACCEALNALIVRALKKEPDQRQSSMEELLEELQEAVKRDSIKLRSFRNLSQALSLEARLEEDSQRQSGGAALEAAGQEPGPGPAAAAANPSFARGHHLLAALARALSGLFRGRGRDEPGSSFVLLNCPYCSAPVESTIKFCLDCGHILPSPQELSRLRTAQGVFHYPRAQRTGADHPEFSAKAKRVTSGSGGLWGTPKVLWLVNLLIVLLLAFLYFGGSDLRKSLSMGVSNATGAARDSSKRSGKHRAGSTGDRTGQRMF